VNQQLLDTSERLSENLRSIQNTFNSLQVDIDNTQIKELVTLMDELQMIDSNEANTQEQRLKQREEVIKKIERLEAEGVQTRNNLLADELDAKKLELEEELKSLKGNEKIVIEQRKEVVDQILDIDRELTDLKKEQLDTQFENEKANNEKIQEEVEKASELRKENQEQLNQNLQQIATEGANFVNALFDNQIAKEEARFSDAQRRGQLELALAGDNEERKKEIAQSNFDREEAIRLKIVEQQRKQAIFNKAIAVAQISIDTASSIAKTLAVGGAFAIPLAVSVGSIGALQLATVLASPIPQFATGTMNAPEGPALTQEKGREIITDKKGTVMSMGSDKGAQMTSLKKGWKVYTAKQTEGMLKDMDGADIGKMSMNAHDLAGSQLNSLVVDSSGNLTKEDMNEVMNIAMSKIQTHEHVSDERESTEQTKDIHINYVKVKPICL
jgi:hypothetical protein